MSGVEVLGVVASIAQLVAYAITVSSKLNEIRSKIRNAPKKLEQYSSQFKEVVTIAEYIQKNPPGETEELDLYISAIVSKTTAIHGILINFEKLSRNRRRWNIISGELSRQLDESFGDVKNTMGNLLVLIASQNSRDQRELRDFILRSSGVTTLPEQATTHSITSLCPRPSIPSLPSSASIPSLPSKAEDFAPPKNANRNSEFLLGLQFYGLFSKIN
ncbi:hypothetical protein GGS24DRAFT_90624 [Hypoxylon argillaceum]|nr:hypothetical protein GGS24DRAFT_90624 [Hypoxylon argillaceum]